MTAPKLAGQTKLLQRFLTALWLLPLAGLLLLAGAAPSPALAQTLGRGQVLISHDHALAMRDLATGVERTLVQLPNADFVHSPTWLPGGKGLLYVDQRAYLGNRDDDYGSDIWTANADGSNPRLIWQHDARGADVAGLAVTPDGTAVLFGYTRTDLNNGVYAGQVIELRRLDLASGRVTKVLDGAGQPAISPDSRTLAYVYTDAPDLSSYGVWLANADGSAPAPLVTGSAGFLSFGQPRFSPDGRRVLFATALAPAGAAADRYAAVRDGPPQDIWVAPTNGAAVTRLTSIAEDQPSGDWSADGSRVVVIGSTGLYLIGADGTGLTRLGDGYLHAELSWLDR